MNGSCSSVGQSVGLMSRRSRVQAPPGPFFKPFLLFTSPIFFSGTFFCSFCTVHFLNQILFFFLHSDHLLPFILLLYFTQVCSFCQKKILKKKQRNAHWSFFYPFYSYILLKFVLLQKKTKIEMKEE